MMGRHPSACDGQGSDSTLSTFSFMAVTTAGARGAMTAGPTSGTRWLRGWVTGGRPRRTARTAKTGPAQRGLGSAATQGGSERFARSRRSLHAKGEAEGARRRHGGRARCGLRRRQRRSADGAVAWWRRRRGRRGGHIRNGPRRWRRTCEGKHGA
jgi:hypothetical protein